MVLFPEIFLILSLCPTVQPKPHQEIHLWDVDFSFNNKNCALPRFFAKKKKSHLPTKESGKLQAIEMPRMFTTWSVARGDVNLDEVLRLNKWSILCWFVYICMMFSRIMGKGFEQRYMPGSVGTVRQIRSVPGRVFPQRRAVAVCIRSFGNFRPWLIQPQKANNAWKILVLGAGSRKDVLPWSNPKK